MKVPVKGTFDTRQFVPKLKDYLQVLITGAQNCQLRYGNDVVIAFDGEDVQTLLKIFSCLDGKRSLREITHQLNLSFQIPEDVSEDLLLTLVRKGLLEDNNIADYIPAEQIDYYADELTFLSRYSINKYGYFSVLKNKSVGVIGLSKVGYSVMGSLSSLGVGSIRILKASDCLERDPFSKGGSANGSNLAGVNPHITIELEEVDTLSPDHLHTFAESNHFDVFVIPLHYFDNIQLYELANEICIARGIPFLSGFIQGDNLEIGPFVVPGATACYYCFETRKKSNVANLAHYQQFEESWKLHPVRMGCKGEPDVFGVLAGNFFALEVYKYLMGFEQPATLNTLVQFNLFTFELTRHHILRLPRCPKCSPVGSQPPKSLWSIPVKSVSVNN